jgi:perosamine synthetase
MIRVCEPYLNGNELKYIEDCLKTNWISSQGKYVEEFEKGFAKYCECKHGVATTSGTTALHLALATLGIKKGDEVIIPTFTNVATMFAAMYCGAKPVLVDCEPDTYCIDVNKIEEKITKKTKCILPVHIYGHPCDMEPIIGLSLKYGLYIVEDAAEAHGAEYKGIKVGSLSHVGCFSFYSNKIITTGEGGMIVTLNEEIANRARLLKDLAHIHSKGYYHQEVGFNYRMTNTQAAIGLAQLENIDKYIMLRRNHAGLYSHHLEDIPGIRLPKEKEWAKNVYWMYGILVDNRDELMERLKDKGIETRPFFIPMHQQPFIKDNGSYPVADKVSNHGLYLPSGSNLSVEDIEYICDCIKEISK